MAQPTVIPTDPAVALAALRGRLLDLTARNRLLHHRQSRDGNLRIVSAAPDGLHQRPLEGKEALQGTSQDLIFVPNCYYNESPTAPSRR